MCYNTHSQFACFSVNLRNQLDSPVFEVSLCTFLRAWKVSSVVMSLWFYGINLNQKTHCDCSATMNSDAFPVCYHWHWRTEKSHIACWLVPINRLYALKSYVDAILNNLLSVFLSSIKLISQQKLSNDVFYVMHRTVLLLNIMLRKRYLTPSW